MWLIHSQRQAVSFIFTKEPLINSSYRRRPVSNSLKPLDSGIRQNDGKRFNQRFPNVLLLFTLLLTDAVFAQDNDPQTIRVTLGDYRFSPSQLTLEAGRSVILELANTDNLTPHNFTLQDEAGGLDIDTSVSAGQVVRVLLTPQVSGSYDFYCNKKLPFMKSHRTRGMQGTLAVTPDGG